MSRICRARRHKRRVYLTADDVGRLAGESGQHRVLVLDAGLLRDPVGRSGGAAGSRRRVSAPAVERPRQRRAARRRPRGGADQEPPGNGRSRCRSSCSTNCRCSAGRGWMSSCSATAALPAAPEVRRRMVRRGGEAGQGAEDHTARPAPHLRLDRDQLRGERAGVVADARAHRPPRSRWTPTPTCSTPTSMPSRQLWIRKCAQSVPKRVPSRHAWREIGR